MMLGLDAFLFFALPHLLSLYFPFYFFLPPYFSCCGHLNTRVRQKDCQVCLAGMYKYPDKMGCSQINLLLYYFSHSRFSFLFQSNFFLSVFQVQTLEPRSLATYPDSPQFATISIRGTPKSSNMRGYMDIGDVSTQAFIHPFLEKKRIPVRPVAKNPWIDLLCTYD